MKGAIGGFVYIFILSSKRRYGLPRIVVVARLTPMRQLHRWRRTRKRVVLRAFDLWGSRPRLSFVDALGATYAQELKEPLASFDADLGKVPGGALWQRPKQSETA